MPNSKAQSSKHNTSASVAPEKSKQYYALETRFLEQVKRDKANPKYQLTKSYYIPNPYLSDKPKFVLVALEPNLGALKFKKQIEFLSSFRNFLLHYCAYKHLCSGSFDYHFTDISKSAMESKEANVKGIRKEIYQNWLPLLKEEIQILSDTEPPKVISIGDTVGNLQLRNLSDMSIIKNYTIPPETDTAGLGSIWKTNIGFIKIAVDPIRPFVYVIRERSGTLELGQHFQRLKVVVYNYETMEEVKELLNFTWVENGQQQSDEYFSSYINYRHLAISKDGKYLALLSEGKSHIRVWDLQTMTLKNQFNLTEQNVDFVYIKFSEKNSENIYFSGYFPPHGNGFFTYNIQENQIIAPTLYGGYGSFTLFFHENEEKMVYAGAQKLRIFVLSSKAIEYETPIAVGDPGTWGDIIHTDLKFIGFAGYYYSMGKYDPETHVDNEPEFKQIVFPNPTNGLINVTLECSNKNQFYEVFNSNSSLAISAQKIPFGIKDLSIDFSSFSNGVYFLRIYCGKTFSTYKIVKKG